MFLSYLSCTLTNLSLIFYAFLLGGRLGSEMPSGSPKIWNRNPEIKTESKFVIKKDTINLSLKLRVLFKENDLSLQFLT